MFPNALNLDASLDAFVKEIGGERDRNPFFKCCTTNLNEQRVCYGYNYTDNNWSYKHTEKKDWVIEKTIYVSVNGHDNFEFCELGESTACRTIGIAVEKGTIQVSQSVTLIEGNHTSETATIEIGTKKISVIGTGKDKSSIGTGALSSSAAAGTLFSASTGHLCLLRMKVYCNSNANPSTPSVAVVSDGSGSFSLEDVVITTSKTKNYVMSSSVFVVFL
ncbi:uncharacterized protein MONOS_7141 [Monocercomonoides exilis]|uniref:uncharacterized protein n=1 Tax=Monocercomonoides exilis TaxID=2049356 RepID=UPI00355A43EA|nr:hypothetical protein MONOS_7141 [Monocercomonoides exilis]|eukprot:MONOS_7141.1-p1 / transcript=MONOS_7141.1 / gene=MONOS_7141 / organism=Monocercomonoides_exilis_PA203 / gene_product=unspecified product / transcript_product=unspecified product / location=Mono_scaffold00237:72926-73935(+) / protein_length=219 / sequence_SO=supercontig / SO=protein_coding / is_pseudo=false